MVSITKAMSRGPYVERIEIFTPSTKPFASIVDDHAVSGINYVQLYKTWPLNDGKDQFNAISRYLVI